MSDEGQEQTPGDASRELREEVAELRERVARLEALLGGARGDSPVQEHTVQASGVNPAAGQSMQAGAGLQEVAPAEAAPSRETPSMETRIGSQWLSKVGILAVLVGVALFLKLAIDNHWIGPVARIVLGLVGGVAIFVGSEPFRRKGYAGFSSTLKGIGTGVLYLSLWASFSLYHLLPGVVAGLGMVVVTVGNGLLAWKRDSLVLAVYSMVGGLLTPFLLSNARHHEVALFAYLLLLSGGAGVLAVARAWNGLMLMAFGGSALYAIVWAFAWYRAGEFTVTVVLAAVGFLLFALIPFAPGSRPSPSGSQTVLSIANATGGVVLAIALYEGLAQALVVLGIAVFYYALVRLRRRSGESPLTAWTMALNGNLALLVGVTLFLHWTWQGNMAASGPHTGEQLTYSFWFMGFGAVLVAVGFRKHRAALRWQGLGLLLVSITKVFVVDMEFLSAGLRVLSFLGLGVLLLIVSFVYQRDWLKLRGKG